MLSPWLNLLLLGGAVRWLLGFPPGGGWLVLPMLPGTPVSLGMVLILAAVMLGGYTAPARLRGNI